MLLANLIGGWQPSERNKGANTVKIVFAPFVFAYPDPLGRLQRALPCKAKFKLGHHQQSHGLALKAGGRNVKLAVFVHVSYSEVESAGARAKR